MGQNCTLAGMDQKGGNAVTQRRLALTTAVGLVLLVMMYFALCSLLVSSGSRCSASCRVGAVIGQSCVVPLVSDSHLFSVCIDGGVLEISIPWEMASPICFRIQRTSSCISLRNWRISTFSTWRSTSPTSFGSLVSFSWRLWQVAVSYVVECVTSILCGWVAMPVHGRLHGSVLWCPSRDSG